MRLRPTISLLCLAALHAQTDRQPSFEDYPAPTRYRGKPAAPQFDTRQKPDSDQRSRESIEIQSEDGANFAGHFTLVRLGCDTGCFQILLIDTPTGRIFRDMPFHTLDIGYNHENEQHKYGGLAYRAASSLLVAEGCFDGEERTAKGQSPDCSRRFYKWDGTRFALLKAVAPSPE